MEDRTSGSPANAFGNALVWKWSREMPRGLKTGFLTTMYACRAMCAASGQLRFSDGKAIRIQDIAKAAGCREQDARRYMQAAILAGLVTVLGERKRGKATLYTLNAMCWPNWKAAEDYLRATARKRPEEEAPQSSDHSGTNSEDESSDHSGSNSPGETPEGVPPTVARPSSGHCGSTGSGHSGSNNPGGFPGVPQEMAEVVTQPHVVAREDLNSDSPKSAGNDLEKLPFGRCEEPTCRRPLTRPNRTRCAAHSDPVPGQRGKGRRSAVQSPLMTVVPAAAPEPSQPASEPFQWRKEDPLAPVRVCGCGREFRSRDSRKCQDCQYAAHPGAHTA